MHTRTIALVAVLAAAMPVAAYAQRGNGVPPRYTRAADTPAYRAGYERGIRRGETDGRDNRQYNYAGQSDYRSGDAGYRRDYGDRERYRLEFRVGFETGYRDGFQRYRPGYGPANGRGSAWRPGAGGPPPWATARGRGSYQRTDLAFRTGFTDGYEAGLRDGRDRDRFDPIGEGRYRSGDHGYNRNYGSRDFYRVRFREGFLEGYEHGFNDGWRYDARYDGRDGARTTMRPGWWPW